MVMLAKSVVVQGNLKILILRLPWLPTTILACYNQPGHFRFWLTEAE
jgi:hypothetical protein